MNTYATIVRYILPQIYELYACIELNIMWKTIIIMDNIRGVYRIVLSIYLSSLIRQLYTCGSKCLQTVGTNTYNKRRPLRSLHET